VRDGILAGEQMEGRGKGLIFIISAPSGTGKTTLVRRVMEELPDLRFSVSYTTRFPRANEREGEDYYFVSSSLFDNTRNFLFFSSSARRGFDFGVLILK